MTICCKYDTSVKIPKKISQDNLIITRLLSMLKYKYGYYLAVKWCGLTKGDKKVKESFKEQTELT